ncbi:serine/threonine-protein kinase [uncultured Thiodictyon sp.]|uniref:serine/threonine-protein kinase n=1 Tax=uncultured Thiodictyon sp. TaxID=1846217 RepID=UPI0025FE6DBC|nr:serine/threonine-protein kinase [uncultured Thiodictyon sp.]
MSTPTILQTGRRTLVTPSPPQTLGKYRIDKVLGEGAMGTVYQGFDPVLERVVAIKTLRSLLLDAGQDGEYLERFRREAKAAAALNHPNIVTVYEYGEDDGIPYIAMELIDGQDLGAHVRANGLPPLVQTLDLMRQLLAGLAYCHAQGIVHRDLKPANCFRLSNGLIKIADFGIARVLNSDLTHFGDQLGSPAYMSPEQFLGETIDIRSDLFSAGIVLYELLTGARPFAGQRMPDIHYRSVTSVDPKLPPAVDKVLRKALALRPADRFQSADEFAAALAGLQPGPKVRPWQRLVWPAAAFIVVALAASGAWLFWPVAPPTKPGTIQVATQPPGATVWLADRPLGTTPYRFELPAGRHAIIIKKDGYADLPTNLEVEPGADIDFELPLVRLKP